MKEQSVILRRLMSRDGLIQRIGCVLLNLDVAEDWEVVIRPYRRKRSDPQNRYLWSLYDYIIRTGGESMAGWTRDDLHDFFLINHFGGETKQLFGKRRITPVRRSSRLNKQEFTDYVESIMRFMAERGVYLPSPEDDWEALLRAA